MKLDCYILDSCVFLIYTAIEVKKFQHSKDVASSSFRLLIAEFLLTRYTQKRGTETDRKDVANNKRLVREGFSLLAEVSHDEAKMLAGKEGFNKLV